MSAAYNLPDFTGRVVDGGRLRLVGVLGAGSFGTVYKALDTISLPNAPKFYAVKCMEAHRFNSQESTLHLACSSHPNVLTYHWQFEMQGGLAGYICLVLELAACDLWSAIKSGVFHNNNALVKKVFMQILDAVRHCHGLGIHHRDIKPENILCDINGSNIHVTDFGLALDDELPCSSPAGTPGYLPPESLVLSYGDTYEPALSDVWACCIVLMNIMLADSPWGAAIENDKDWVAFLENKNYLRHCFPMISDELHDLLTSCFREVPDRRPCLLDLRLAIGKMETFFRPRPQEPPGTNTNQLLAIPIAQDPSAPSTPGASFSFDPSDYPTPASSQEGSSIFSWIDPARLYRPEHPDSDPAPGNALSAPKAPDIASPATKTRNPIRRVCRWIKKLKARHCSKSC